MNRPDFRFIYNIGGTAILSTHKPDNIEYGNDCILAIEFPEGAFVVVGSSND